MKKIELVNGNGKQATVDDDLFEQINKHKWHLVRVKGKDYAQAMIDGELILMHDFVWHLASIAKN